MLSIDINMRSPFPINQTNMAPTGNRFFHSHFKLRISFLILPYRNSISTYSQSTSGMSCAI